MIEKTALVSEMINSATKFDPQNTNSVVNKANNAVIKKARSIIFFIECLDPKSVSSATRRVTAVLIPLVVNVAAKT